MDPRTTLRSNLNRLPRLDMLVTTLKADSKQDVTPGGTGALIVDGGLVVKKGLLLGQSERMVPGAISYLGGHYVGFKEGCQLFEFECKPALQEIEVEMVGDNFVTLTVPALARISSDGFADIWGKVGANVYNQGHINIPFKIKRELTGAINYGDTGPTLVTPNAVAPLVYNGVQDYFEYLINGGPPGNAYVYNWHIQCLVEDEPGCAVPEDLIPFIPPGPPCQSCSAPTPCNYCR